MNLLFMQNGLAPYGIPRNGLVSIIDPYRDTYGRNILPVGAENFVTGWTAYDGSVVTVTQNQTVDEWDTTEATRIQASVGNGTSKLKYYINSGVVLPQGAVCSIKVLVKNIGTNSMGIFTSISGSYIVPAGGIVEATLSTLGNGSSALHVQFLSSTISKDFDILVCQPQVNISTLYTYSPPAGLPQFLTDYTGRGNNAQLGSAAGSDTNDPAWSGNGLTFGTDDYLRSDSPAFDDMQAFTCITVLNIQTGATRIFDKTFNFLTLLPAASYKLNFQQNFASGYYNWMGTIAPTVGSNYIVSASYNRGNPTIAPAFYFNRIKDTVIATVSTGAGNVASDASNDLYIGNRQAADRGILSPLYLQLWYNRILSDAEYMQAYNGLRRLMSARGVVI